MLKNYIYCSYCNYEKVVCDKSCIYIYGLSEFLIILGIFLLSILITTLSISSNSKCIFKLDNDEKTNQYVVLAGDDKYPVFDKENGKTKFKREDGAFVSYDSRIPVTNGGMPVSYDNPTLIKGEGFPEVVKDSNGNYEIKFGGPRGELSIPFESKNGETYAQFKYIDKEGSINISHPDSAGFTNIVEDLKKNSTSSDITVDDIMARMAAYRKNIKD